MTKEQFDELKLFNGLADRYHKVEYKPTEEEKIALRALSMKYTGIDVRKIFTEQLDKFYAHFAIFEWQPMETAPKEGVFLMIDAHGMMSVGAIYYAKNGWFATHWQPLPTPPEPKKEVTENVSPIKPT